MAMSSEHNAGGGVAEHGVGPRGDVERNQVKVEGLCLNEPVLTPARRSASPTH